MKKTLPLKRTYLIKGDEVLVPNRGNSDLKIKGIVKDVDDRIVLVEYIVNLSHYSNIKVNKLYALKDVERYENI